MSGLTNSDIYAKLREEFTEEQALLLARVISENNKAIEYGIESVVRDILRRESR